MTQQTTLSLSLSLMEMEERRGSEWLTGDEDHVEVHRSLLCLTSSAVSLSLFHGPLAHHKFTTTLYDSDPIPHCRASTAASAPSTARFSIAMAHSSGGLAP
jgi:hypothetical protein